MKKFYIIVLALVSIILVSCTTSDADKLAWSYVYADMSASVLGFKDDVSPNSKKTLTIPSISYNEYDGDSCIVTTIAPYAFKGCVELEKLVLPSTIVEIEEGAFEDCINLKEVIIPNKENIRISGTAFKNCVKLNVSEFLPSEQVIRVHIKGFEPNFVNEYVKIKKFSCDMTGGRYLIKGGHDIATSEITIPEGQRWAYKDYNLEYHCRDNYGWLTKPYIILRTGRRDKQYQLPDEGRDVVFYPGDRILIGTYCAHGYFEYIDMTVKFFIDYN